MTKINLHEAKAHLSHYARLVKAGETVILCERNKPFAEIRPIGEAATRKPKRILGLMKGLFPYPPDFNIPDHEIEDTEIHSTACSSRTPSMRTYPSSHPTR